MSATATEAPPESTARFFPLVFQYTLEAYKTFQKLAEHINNPILAKLFKSFAEDERAIRDILEIHYLEENVERMKVTLGSDLRFEEILKEELSDPEQLEWLISRERTIESRLREHAGNDRSPIPVFYRYLAHTKRSHATLLERERELLHHYPDWFRREDALNVLIKGGA